MARRVSPASHGNKWREDRGIGAAGPPMPTWPSLGTELKRRCAGPAGRRVAWLGSEVSGEWESRNHISIATAALNTNRGSPRSSSVRASSAMVRDTIPLKRSVPFALMLTG